MRRHDGVYRWFSIRYEPHRDEQGRIVRGMGALSTSRSESRSSNGPTQRMSCSVRK